MRRLEIIKKETLDRSMILLVHNSNLSPQIIKKKFVMPFPGACLFYERKDNTLLYYVLYNFFR